MGRQKLNYKIMFCFVALAIVPLSMSNMTNRGRIDILSFVRRQGSRQQASKRKILTGICIALNAAIAGTYLFSIFLAVLPVSTMLRHLSYKMVLCLHLGVPYMSPEQMIFFIKAGLALAVVLGVAGFRCFLHRKNQTTYPLCLSLGGLANADYEPQSDDYDDTADLVNI